MRIKIRRAYDWRLAALEIDWRSATALLGREICDLKNEMTWYGYDRYFDSDYSRWRTEERAGEVSMKLTNQTVAIGL